MTYQALYTDFYDNVSRLKEIHRRDLHEIPDTALSRLAEYYLNKRLFILNEKPVKLDPRQGRPAPYLAFWFSTALGLHDPQKLDQLALTLSYASIICSIRDDLIDGRVVLNGKLASEHAHVSLANFFYDKYLHIFKKIFTPSSTFWYILSESLNEYGMYEYWNFLTNNRMMKVKGAKIVNPLSVSFLKRSSQYMVNVFFPTIAAIYLLTDNDRRLARAKHFLVNYFAGVRIADDLRDWEKDMKSANYNCSSVIHFALQQGQRKKIGIEGIQSMFFNQDFVTTLYGVILRLYNSARKDASLINSKYLVEFMDGQIDFYQAEKHFLIEQKRHIGHSLIRLLQNNGIQTNPSVRSTIA